MNEQASDDAPTTPVRVAIVGTGNVGSTYAYALLWSGLAEEIVLINRSQEDAEGEAMDLTHAVPFAQPTRVWAGDYADCAGAAVVALTLGAAQGDAPDRLALVEQNGKIFAEVVPEVVAHAGDAVLLVSSNPVDVLTYATWRHSGLPRGRVIGSGTVLDTARLRALLGDRLGLDPRDLHVDVVGEHGDSQVVGWEAARVGGSPLATFAAAAGVPLGERERRELADATRRAGPLVAERKGATYYGVAAAMLRITGAVVRDERSVLTVSSVVDGVDAALDGVALSLPSVVGRAGVERVIQPVLSADEMRALRESADVLRRTQDDLPEPTSA
jgi:L-lactate dehydrogenase